MMLLPEEWLRAELSPLSSGIFGHGVALSPKNLQELLGVIGRGKKGKGMWIKGKKRNLGLGMFGRERNLGFWTFGIVVIWEGKEFGIVDDWKVLGDVDIWKRKEFELWISGRERNLGLWIFGKKKGFGVVNVWKGKVWDCGYLEGKRVWDCG